MADILTALTALTADAGWQHALLLFAAAAGAGMLAAGPLTDFAARRSARQPIDLDGPGEAAVLAAVVAHPEVRSDLLAAGVDASVFAHPPHRAVWEATGATPAALDDLAGADEAAYRQALSATVTSDPVQVAEQVVRVAEERRTMSGRGRREPTGDPDLPERRVVERPSRRRRVAVGGLAAAAAVVLPPLAAAAWPAPTAATVAAVGAAALLAAGMFVVALVDIDTLRGDFVGLTVGVVGAWLAAVAAALIGGQPFRLLVGLLVVLFVVAALEGTAWVFRRLRGVEGIGFGDTLILIGTVGVPTALTGAPELGMVSMVAGFTGAALVHLRRIAAGGGRSVPEPAGPALAAGWVVGWLLWTVGMWLAA